VLVEMKLISQSERQTFERLWEERSQDAGAFFCTPPMIEVIGVKR
jgi:hypothetical protein